MGAGGFDARPRVYMRQRSDVCEAAIGTVGPWVAVTSLHDAIDHVGGEGAHESAAVIMWEGYSDA